MSFVKSKACLNPLVLYPQHHIWYLTWFICSSGWVEGCTGEWPSLPKVLCQSGGTAERKSTKRGSIQKAFVGRFRSASHWLWDPGKRLNYSCGSVSHIWNHLYPPSSADVWDFQESEQGNNTFACSQYEHGSMPFVGWVWLGGIERHEENQNLPPVGPSPTKSKSSKQTTPSKIPKSTAGHENERVTCDTGEFHAHTVSRFSESPGLAPTLFTPCKPHHPKPMWA